MSTCTPETIPVVKNLLQVPDLQRDPDWYASFYAAVVQAGYAQGKPPIFYGPDGFAYFNLVDPPIGESYEGYCIAELLEYLTSHGIGVSINATLTGQSADWVFSCGDILSYRLFGTFEAPSVPDTPAQEQIPAGTQLRIGAPDPDLLPEYTCKVLGRFMKESLGIPNPGVLLLQKAESEQQELVFSIHPEDYDTFNQFQSVLQSLSWFLPRGYPLSAVSKSSPLAKSFFLLPTEAEEGAHHPH
jgi:hypothetical protein